ncbi:hypothetical protein AALA13_13520 [Lachnospiraceae bacterium 50-23]|uniref:Uncharacterized protein n=2 Tax=Acutalibacter muris TaxID=1796620 RepID=A0AA92L7Z0_9FIRM|nr:MULTISPECIES: hypothetical protein [Lachnospiraceae]QQR30684.1 hypothetical protein I5Q82_02965 [Acutalibacter muris]
MSAQYSPASLRAISVSCPPKSSPPTPYRFSSMAEMESICRSSIFQSQGVRECGRVPVSEMSKTYRSRVRSPESSTRAMPLEPRRT